MKRTLSVVAGRHFVQKALQKNIQYSQYLMGVGSGADVSSSGETAILKILRDKRRLPYCIFDVGSNMGQFLKLILAGIGTDQFQIHCFEPGHYTYRLLLENVRPDHRVRLNNIGIGREMAQKQLHYDHPGSGGASLTKRRVEHLGSVFGESETVEVDSIDHYCEQNGIKGIDLLKLDIEGHEFDALQGAASMFERSAIHIVTFEFGGGNIDTRTYFQDFWYFFKQFDMGLFRITPAGYLYPIESYNEIDEQFRTTNFVAVRNGQ
jgi:FkbM family methyltransferase